LSIDSPRLHKKSRNSPAPGSHIHNGVDSFEIPGLSNLLNPPVAKISKNGTQTILNTTEATIHFAQTDFSHGGLVDLANDRFTIVDPGIYTVKYHIKFVNGTANTWRKGFLYLNSVLVDTSVCQEPAIAYQGSAICKGAVDLLCAAGDHISLTGYHNNGGPLDVTNVQGNTWMSIIKVRSDA